MEILDEHLSDVGISPHGHLLIEAVPPFGSWLDVAAARRVMGTFRESTTEGLLRLATHELEAPLPPGAVWWRNFARLFVSRLCHTPATAETGALPEIPPPTPGELESLIESAPPMRGGEYLDAELLNVLWCELNTLTKAQIATHPEGMAGWIGEADPVWCLLGRVTFHLAENKGNADFPFAFMASYATRLSSQSKVQQQQLGRALQEFAGTHNQDGLRKLLEPVQRAAGKSTLVQQLVESGRIFKPLLWRPSDAYRFLCDTPVFEEAGLVVRLPDWWKGSRPPRAKVNVRIGSHEPAMLGKDALLDFSVGVALEGELLTPEELQSILSATDGLAFVRGRWVEADAEKLRSALDQWKRIEQQAADGQLSFHEGMRLLSGFPRDAGTSPGAEREGSDHGHEWVGLEAGEWLGRILEKMRDPAAMEAVRSIPGLRAELRPYQKVGVEWLRFITQLGLGGCLADDMGLGKTIQVLALLLLRQSDPASCSRPGQPSLLVAPASLLSNWKAEITRFAPSIRTVIVHPSENATGGVSWPPQGSAAGDIDFVLTTYGMVPRLEALRKFTWDLVILDEAQAIKNADTRQTRAVKELKGMARFALTGTPVENRATDLWSIFDFINPGLLGSAREFSQFLRARGVSGSPDYSAVRRLSKPYILRRLKTDKRIISDLPEKTELSAWCGLSAIQAALYAKSVEELRLALEDAEGIQRKGLVLAFLMRFKQICNHPSQWLKDGAYDPAASGKFGRLRELAEEIAERQEKALVFTQFREITDPLAAFLTSIFGKPGLVLHGGTTVRQRKEMVDAFQTDEGPPFFVLTVKAGGSGLNLTEAAHVLHFDRWWNPAVENQATDRAFRIGQKKNVLVHKFVCRGTVEERIDRMIADKKAVSDELLEGGSEKLLSEMGDEELMAFVSLDLQRAAST